MKPTLVRVYRDVVGSNPMFMMGLASECTKHITPNEKAHNRCAGTPNHRLKSDTK